MKIIISAIIQLITINIIGQTLKNYNGDFTGGLSENGTASFYYLEDPITRNQIKDGVFKFTYNGLGETRATESINGSFSKGLKHGVWNHTIIMTDYENGSEFLTGTITLVANYKNGYADGNWKEVRNYKTRTGRYRLGKYYWESYGPIKSMIISMNFKNGLLVGEVDIKDEFAKFTAKGNFNDSSLANGNWIVIDNAWVSNKELIYKEGFLYETVFRGSSGEVTLTSKFHDDFEKFTKSKSLNQDEREAAEIKINKVCGENCAATNNIQEYFNKLFSNNYFPKLGGDLTYNEGFKGGCELKYSACFSYSKENFGGEHFKNAENKINENEFSNALYELSQISLTNLCKSDKKIIQDKVDFCNQKLAELKKDQDRYLEFQIQEYDSLRSFNAFFWKQFKPRQITSITFSYPQCHPQGNTNCRNRLILQEYDVTQFNTEIEKELAVKQFKYDEKISKVLDYQRKEQKFEQFLVEIDKTRNDYISIKEIYLNFLSINLNEEEIIKLNNSNKKKSVLKKYQEVANEIKLLINNNTLPLNKRNENAKTLINFSEKIIDLYKNNSEEIENKIKKTNTTSELIELLKN